MNYFIKYYYFTKEERKKDFYKKIIEFKIIKDKYNAGDYNIKLTFVEKIRDSYKYKYIYRYNNKDLDKKINKLLIENNLCITDKIVKIDKNIDVDTLTKFGLIETEEPPQYTDVK